MVSLAPAFQTVPEFLQDDVEHRRKLAFTINLILSGKLNGFIDFTLTANAASSTLTDARVGYYSTILLMPQTANAAAALATTYIAQATMKSGSCVITHANNAQVDKSFRILIIG